MPRLSQLTEPIPGDDYSVEPTMTTSIKSRLTKDRWATRLVSVGGAGVIMAVALIFFYLLYEVVPMFRSAQTHHLAEFSQPLHDGSETVHLAVEEQGEYGLRINRDGRMQFFSTADGHPVEQQQLPLPTGAHISAIAGNDPDGGLLALGLSSGSVLVVEYGYRLHFVGDNRQLTPWVEFPYGEQPVELVSGESLTGVAIQSEDENTALIAAAANGELARVRFVAEQSFLGLDDAADIEIEKDHLGRYEGPVCQLLMDRIQQLMVVAGCEGVVSLYRLSDAGAERVYSTPVVQAPVKLTAVEFVSGTYSLLIGDSSGQVQQWFPLFNADRQLELERVRGFKTLPGGAAIRLIVPEERRKGFAVLAEDGQLGIYNTTSERQLLAQQQDKQTRHIAFAPRSNYLLLEQTSGTQTFVQVDNEYPEVSWSALWNQVWYESYDEPDYIWQSSAATNDFEPKFSLTPLVFGTIKAAFYAMLFAMPIAILGAIYTGYFMHPRLRGLVKPAIENMEALPTVIIGFLAGLWLAPALENNLPGLFALMVISVPAVMLLSLLVYQLPSQVRTAIPDGVEVVILIPFVLFLGYLSFSLSGTIEGWIFDGDMRAWINHELGLDFDQRNSVVVGIAMGVAVMPTIFSMTEDAVFGVPKHLTQGSLALGATPWQTLSRVVILTASPGIFSAVMIGLGRAVGETMVVLMATGNTPIMDFNIFSGMRTLAANIAVEMPESEVGSTHYRVLFLAALVLFSLTFVFNTVAELVRQRLRERYSSL
ncbi:MAG: ABC transporter permease subunit [Gammaproteobacteria bacterium]